MADQTINGFNLRVYGILFNQYGEVLVSDECRNNFSFTKFPGGGLEFGEGLSDCLKREFKEELQLLVDVHELLYVNDFLQVSRFDLSHQLLAFYYRVSTPNTEMIPHGTHHVPLMTDGEKHRWMNLQELHPDAFTFPIDKLVVQQLKTQYQST